MKKFLLALVSVLLLLPLNARAESTDELKQRLDSLQNEMKALQGQLQQMEKQKEAAAAQPVAVQGGEGKEAAKGVMPSWLEIGGDFRTRVDYLSGSVAPYTQFFGYDQYGNPVTQTFSKGLHIHQNSILTNRFGLNIKAKATEDVQVKARLVMFKVWGDETANPYLDKMFADRSFVFDGVSGHVPEDNTIRADYAYATWSNIAGLPTWFSIGRRPSTGGVPLNIKEDAPKIGTAGIPAILVDYAFDGLSAGYAPYIDALPNAYIKVCYGRGYDAGFRGSPFTMGQASHSTDFLGINVVPYDTDNLNIELQWNRGMNIFDSPSDGNPLAGTIAPTTNLGDIDWFGGSVLGTVMGNLNLFVSAATSMTHPNGKVSPFGGGLLSTDGHGSHTGYGVFVGGRYDLPTATKIGAEFNYGDRNWIGMVPASDDIWTSKLGTRGKVYEAYVIQELKRTPISKLGKAFFRLGYQYYQFDYTGSNNWVGAPEKIDTLSLASPQFMPPVKNASDIYLTFDVRF